MQELLLIIRWILFAFLIISAISGFFYIRNAFKNNINLSNVRLSQWAFSVILCLLFSFTNLDKIDLIYFIPIFYLLSLTYFGSFIAVVTLSLLNQFTNDNRDLISRVENETYNGKEVIRQLCFEFDDNIQNIILPKTKLNQKKFIEMEGIVFSIFVIYAFYLLIIKKQQSPKQEIEKYGNEMRSFIVHNRYQQINGTNQKEEIDRENGRLVEEYDYLKRDRFDQYYIVLQNGLNHETINQLMGIFAENFFMEPINEDDKRHFIENMAIMLSQYIEKFTSEIKW